jgi:tetratricopeptide (TPR) repeat protein
MSNRHFSQQRRFITILSLLFLSFPVCIFAETIVLKSGKTIEAKIIQKTDKEIALDFSGALMTYTLDEIESINGKRAQIYQPNINTQEEKKDISASHAVLNKGLDYLDRKMYDDAIAEFNKAIEINPDYTDAYYNRGLSNAKKGNLDQAISDYSKAIEINPNDADTYFNRGLAYHKKNQFDQAISDYTKSIQINPHVGDTHYNRALDYYLKGIYDKAWDDVHKAQDLGYEVNSSFLERLKKDSGRKE